MFVVLTLAAEYMMNSKELQAKGFRYCDRLEILASCGNVLLKGNPTGVV